MSDEHLPGPHAEPMQRFQSARLVPWIFAAKTTAAGLLALFVAFTFDLDQPQWALLTVFIVSQPMKDGLVLAKSFYRIIGTCIGAGGALVLVALFAQERVLFLGALALWIGLCAFGSQYARNWAAYGFVLSGYTVAIVGIPGALDPGNAFYIATARVTEISLGIATVATISHLVLPMSLATPLRQAIAGARAELSDYIMALLPMHDGTALRAKLLGRAVAIENLRTSAIFEDRAIRDRAGILRQLVVALIDVINVTQLLGRQLVVLRRSPEAGTGISEAIAATTRTVEAWRAGAINGAGLGTRLRQASAELPSMHLLSGDRTVPDDRLMERIATLGVLREFLAAMAAYAASDEAFVSGAPRPPTRADFGRANDFAAALWTGLRAGLAVLLVGWFWIAANWPHGSTATILGVVATARLATMGHAVPLAIAATLIFSLSTIPAFILVETLLPLASGFPMFALVVAPMLFLCAFLMAHERTMIIGYLSALLFASVGMFQDRMAYDPIGLINTSLAAIVAAAVAMVLWAIAAPETADAARRRFVRTTRKLLASIARPRRPIRPDEFETAMAEALDRLRGALHPGRPAGLAALDEGAALLIAGRELVRLRQDGRSFPAAASLGCELSAAAASRDCGRFDRTREAAQAVAEQCLVELRDHALGAEEAQVGVRNIVAFTTIRYELERGCALLAGGTGNAARSDAA